VANAVESTGGDKGLWRMQFCGQVHYHATSQNLESRMQLDGLQS
jgi:hypothetical protein